MSETAASMPAKSLSPVGAASAEPRRSPRERLLDAANELFYAEGVQSVGIDRVIERAGVAKASLYSTFGSKEALVQAYLDSRHEQTLGRLRRAVASAGEDPVDRLLAVFDSQATFFSQPGFNGCAFTAARSEAPAGGRIETAASAYRQDLRGLFRALAAAAGATDPDTLAAQLHMIYDGAAAAANQDDDPGIAVPARAAAEGVVHAALSRC
jgi:AcrR family transcriptional regulator